MKSQYVDELKAGQVVKGSFVLSKKILKEKKDGGAEIEFFHYLIVHFRMKRCAKVHRGRGAMTM